MTISDQLRNAIRSSGVSANELSRTVRIPQPTITRFLQGTGMQSGNLDRLAAYFGLTLVASSEVPSPANTPNSPRKEAKTATPKKTARKVTRKRKTEK